MKTINFKGKGEHSVNELELIIEQQAEELHLIKSGQKQLILSGVSQQRELLPYFLYKDDFGIKIGYHGDTEVSEEWNDYLKKLGNCG
jgi:hypothetical protein